MKKINIVKSSDEFTRIIKSIKPKRFKGYLVFVELNNNDHFEFGITVSKKVGNAVIRNRIKRQFKSIIDKNNYQKSFKCIIIIKKEALENTYEDIEKSLNKYFSKINLLEEKDEKV